MKWNPGTLESPHYFSKVPIWGKELSSKKLKLTWLLKTQLRDMNFKNSVDLASTRCPLLSSVYILLGTRRSYAPSGWGFPGGTSREESACQCRGRKRVRFGPWFGKIPCSRKWQPTPVFLLGKFHEQKSLAGYSILGSQRVGHDWACVQHPPHTHPHTPLNSLEFLWSWVFNQLTIAAQKHHSPRKAFKISRERRYGMCMYVCIYIYVYIYVCVCVHIHIYTQWNITQL